MSASDAPSVMDRPCCRAPEHAALTTGERAAAHEDRNARVDLALEVVLPLLIAGAGLVLLLGVVALARLA